MMDMMRFAEEERISRRMSNPVPIRHSQYRPILLSDRPATVNILPPVVIDLTNEETITSTPAGLITLPVADTITSTPAELITLPEAETITSIPEGLITITEAGCNTETQAEAITDILPEVITASLSEPITVTLSEPITDTLPEVFMDLQAEHITATLPEPITDTLPEDIMDFQAEHITDTLPEPITATLPEPITDTLPEVFMDFQAEPITDTLPDPITDTLPEDIMDIQAEPIIDTCTEITDPQTEPITETKADLVFTETNDVTPVMPLDERIAEATATLGANDIKLSNSMDDFIKEFVQPATLCTQLHSAQADVPSNDEDNCDPLLSFLTDIPELNPDHCSLPKNSTFSTATPKSVTPSHAMQKNTMYTVSKQKKEAKRDYKEYPEYTPRTDPVISWDELIVKYEKLANTNNKEQTTNQDKTDLVSETAKHEAVSQKEELKPAGQSQSLDVEESPSCSQSSVVPCEQVHLGKQELPMEVTTEQCEKASDSPLIELLVPSPASSKEIQKPTTDPRTPNPTIGIVENKIKRKQHTSKHSTENVSERTKLLEALEKKKQKAIKVLNEQYNKSWDGKIFARSRAQTESTVQKPTKPTVTTVPSKYQQSTKVNEHIGVLNKQTANGVSQPAKVVSQPAKVVSQPAKTVSKPAKVVSQPAKVASQQTTVVSQPTKVVSSQPAKVVSQPAKVVSQPAKVVSQPTSSQSRKRPASSSVDTVMSASSAKRAREYKHRIILRIFREDSDWNVEQIVDRF